MGSLRKNSLREIWENEEKWHLFREPLTIDGKCKTCGYLYACKSGCRIMSYINTGSMGGPDIGCTYNPLNDN
jgi:radical SAM protein with 4Fe4S-binding SPASM domain